MRTHLLPLASPLLAVLASTLLAQEAPQPPVAKRVAHQSTWHGRTLEDPWFWLREKQNPEVRAYLTAENAYTAAMTKGQAALRETLYAEMVARVQQTDLSVPVRDGGFFYFSCTQEGLQYPLSCRRPATKDGVCDEAAPQQVLLDPNAMGKGLAYFGLGDQQVSDDGNLLAYTTDTTGFRQYTLHVKDLRSGEVQKDLAERVTGVEWSADGKTLFFSTEDAVTKRSDQLWRLELGKAPELVSEEKDELFGLRLLRTRDKRFLLLVAGSTDTTHWWQLDASTPAAKFAEVMPRQRGHRYRLEHGHGSFFVVTDNKAPNFRVVQVPEGKVDLAAGKEIVAASADVLVTGFDVFATHAVVQERTQALARFRMLDFASGTWREITFPEAVYSASAGGTPEFTSTTYRINYQSMVTPACVYDIDFRTGARTLKKQTQVNGYDATKYKTERLWAKARDGVRVPMSIVYRADRARDGTLPLWLYAYGSYGAAMPASFDSNRISLLDRGVAFAIAHIRGGNDLGEQWHKDGMLMHKKNTFFDFIDCAEFLIAERWVAKDKLVIEGGSAGGLLMGAVANLRPELFAAVHSAVPFVDVMNTMLDASLPLTVGEYLEWGNPNEKAAFDYMLSYSPYDNLAATSYPPTLVTTSFNDSQVMYWEPAKYVAKLRALTKGAPQSLLQCKLEAAGHGGASGRYDRWRDRAFEMAWMLARVGITQ